MRDWELEVDRMRLLGPALYAIWVSAYLALAVPACARAIDADDVNITWSVEPSSPVAGSPVVATLTLRDRSRQPVTGATLEIEGHMSHPGMAPVLAAARETHDGVYQVRLEFSMAGDWIVLVKGSLADGRTLNHRIDIPGVRPG